MKPFIVVIAGPTGIGKSAVALQLASLFDGEIVNADASSVRQELNIGTAKPHLEHVDVKHHLFDIIKPQEGFSIKDFQLKAFDAISLVHQKNKLPIVVGGSGLYIASILGNYNLNVPSRNPEFEKEFAHLDNLSLHQELAKINKAKADVIHPNNRRRVLRAIEIESTNQTSHDNPVILPYDAFVVCLTCDRNILYERINHRVEEMFSNGWILEVESLIRKNIDVAKLQEIGYKEINEYLKGKGSLEQFKEIIKQKTRNYAKRQMTWFKNKLNGTLVEVNYGDLESTTNQIYALIHDFRDRR